MSRKFTESDIEEMVDGAGYIYLYHYRKESSIIVIIKDAIGYKYETNLHDLLNGHIPFPISKYNPFSIENIFIWIRINDVNVDPLDNNHSFSGSKQKINLLCKKCNQVFDISWNDLYNGRRCPYCSGKRVGKYTNLEYLEPEVAKDWNYSRNNGKIPSDFSRASGESVWWNCSVCQYEWKSKINSRTCIDRGCPNCSSSKGEKKISEILDNFTINYVRQECFDDCKNKRELPFDFYLPDYTLCIEYHGEQHYKVIEFFGDKEGFRKRQINDNIKEKYCSDNGINLLVIPYWEFNNIEEILVNTLSEIERS